MASLESLERTAVEVLNILKGIEEFKHTYIAVIGGLALWKYNPLGRFTEDVDFLIDLHNAPGGVKSRLLNLPESPFVEHAQFFSYKSADGQLVQIDICPSRQSPYVPAGAVKLIDLPDNTIPYISSTDLIVFKIHSCGLRAQREKRRVDAKDAEALLSQLAVRSPLALTDRQKLEIEPCIADVVEYGSYSEAWWRQRLGMPVQK